MRIIEVTFKCSVHRLASKGGLKSVHGAGAGAMGEGAIEGPANDSVRRKQTAAD